MKCFPSISTEKNKQTVFHQLSLGNNALFLKLENNGIETNERKTKLTWAFFNCKVRKSIHLYPDSYTGQKPRSHSVLFPLSLNCPIQLNYQV